MPKSRGERKHLFERWTTDYLLIVGHKMLKNWLKIYFSNHGPKSLFVHVIIKFPKAIIVV